MAGQVAYHLLAQAGAARAPWPITTPVSCLPVLVLAMGTALAHMLRADAHTTADGPGDQTGGPAASRSAAWSAEDQAGDRDHAPCPAMLTGSGPPPGTATVPERDREVTRTRTPALAVIEQARLAGKRLGTAGKPVSRRALRREGIKGSNEALNALARTVNAEIAGTAASLLVADAPAELPDGGAFDRRPGTGDRRLGHRIRGRAPETRGEPPRIR